jgi:frataxin-like iron-binding protein CyaY
LSSGPKRFNYDDGVKSWRNTRDGHHLFDLLSSELSTLLERRIEFKN